LNQEIVKQLDNIKKRVGELHTPSAMDKIPRGKEWSLEVELTVVPE